jgi:hypothetical protein
MLPLWRLYAYAVASFGLFLPIWVYRVARNQDPDPARRTTHACWAAGCFIPAVCMALLHHFTRQASAGEEAGSENRRTRRWLPAHPSLLFAAVVLLWWLTPLSGFWFLSFLLLPVPFLFVQRQLNLVAMRQPHDATVSPPPAPAPLWRRALQVGLTVAGLAGFGLATWKMDRHELARLVAAESAGAIRGTSGLYELHLGDRSWVRVEPGTYGDSDSDLELRGPGSETWIVVYAAPAGNRTLESVVSSRRGQLFEEFTPLRFGEERSFLPSADLVPLSVARYLVDFGLGAQGAYVVLTAQLETHMVEVIGYTGEMHRAQWLDDLVRSFALSPEPGAA